MINSLTIHVSNLKRLPYCEESLITLDSYHFELPAVLLQTLLYYNNSIGTSPTCLISTSNIACELRCS